MRNRLFAFQFGGFILRRCFSTAGGNRLLLPAFRSPLLLPKTPYLRNGPDLYGSQFRGLSVRFFSSRTDEDDDGARSTARASEEEEGALAKLISDELRKNRQGEGEVLPLAKRLDLSFSHVTVTPALLLATLNISPDAGRTVLDFLTWAKSRPGFSPTDEVFSYYVNYFGRRKDFKAAHEVLADNREAVGVKCFEAIVDRLVRAGRPNKAVELFDRMEADYGFERSFDSLKHIISCLCERGHASHAEKMVKSLASEFFPDAYICDALISGWCIDGKLDEARRLMNEMHRGGFEMTTFAYNSLLDCVCRLCREKDRFRLQSEAQKLLVEMERNGVPRNVDTFNVLITNLCRIRKTEEAMNLFSRMGEWGCYPDETTYIVLIKSLYRAARISEGDDMMDRMKSAGYGDALDKKVYYEFIRVLCGVERISHALAVFAKMKEGCRPGIKTYDLLMRKLCAHGRVEKANALYKEAERNGVAVEPKEYRVDPKFVPTAKSAAAAKKTTTRETLPEKMARKRRRLKQIRLSFVKKPKKNMRAAY
ncbi:hypothetical protein M569_13492 [Genlisea aurea]|uniref:Pentacotripeptide-repeat region of PRORP domain-containing protein n=1 Tax=Genlisea aurea TaxID=192259 RepID=S8DNJ3_9LAMI|nr:hypothetical protein M569_13492 [Genlisea aurea]